MKYLKLFESDERLDKIRKGNTQILNEIDILVSFADRLTEAGLYSYSTFGGGAHRKKDPVRVRVNTNGGQSDIESFSKYVNNNFDKDIPTLQYSVSGIAEKSFKSTKAISDEEVELAIEELRHRLKELAPNCRIDIIRKKFSKDLSEVYSKGQYVKSDSIEMSVDIHISNNKAQRYR